MTGSDQTDIPNLRQSCPGVPRARHLTLFFGRWNNTSSWRPLAVAALAGALVLGISLGGHINSSRVSASAAAPLLPLSSPATIRETAGANAAAIQTTVDTFRTDLGTLRPNTKSSFTSGRRELSWDGVSDAAAAPAALPGDFFNSTSPRGIVFATPGSGFQVSMDDDTGGDIDPDQVRFDNINASYSSQFSVFSPQRLFTAIGSNITDVTFFVPGTNIPATVTGFGAVFTDVDTAGSTNIQFFDPDGHLLLIHNVLPASQGLSFLGVKFTGSERISKVRITSGNVAPGPNDNPGGGFDVVVMDDFIYAEPQPAVCPPHTITGDIGQGSADYPSSSGVQTGRISNNGVVSDCNNPKSCTGVINGGTFAFDSYQFPNNTNATICVTFTFPPSCGANQAIHPVAYLGSFDPSNPCTNYLGDNGQNVNVSEGAVFSVNVPANSILVLVVHELGTVPDCSYSFSVSGLPPCYQAQLPCPPSTITGNIGQGSTDYPSTSGQSGRIANNGVDSTCASPKACPGLPVNLGTFNFDAYQFANTSVSPACVTFSFPVACGPNQAIHAVAYLNSYDPTNVCANYLGDFGHNVDAATTGVFSVNVPAGAIVVLVVHELGVSPGCSYSFTVSGLPACPPAGGCALTCPNSLVVGNTPGQCGAAVGYDPPTATGVCGAITCSPPGGSFFPIGATTVTCTEAGSAQTCNFTVTVNDTQPPLITCPPNQTAVGTTGTVVTYPSPGVSDNCPGVSAVCNPPSGSTFSLGITTVTCTARDAVGNTASCSFTVTTFDVCIQDDSNAAAVILFNSKTGQYVFCCDGSRFAGTGTASKVGLTISLTDNNALRRVQAKVDLGLARGSASLQAPIGVNRCTITDRNVKNNTCSCQ